MKLMRSCPACGNSGGGKILFCNKMVMPESIALPNGYNVVECENCGCCYADTSAKAEDYELYYSTHNYYGANWQYNSSTEFDLNVIVKLLKKNFSKKSVIIDMGCGNGRLLTKLMQEKFNNIIGVDPSSDSINAIQDMGIRGYVGSIYEKGSDEIPKADVVILTMVLEHLYEPIEAIESLINNYLKNDGSILLTWPHFEDLMIDDSAISNNFNHEHINYFGKNHVDRLLARVGFISQDYHISIGAESGKFIAFSNIALYGKDEKVKNFEIQKDEKTANSILEYFQRGEETERQIIKKISELAQTQEDVVIWGTGAYLYHLMAVSMLKECKINFIVDNNKLKQGQTIYNLEVLTPESIKIFNGIVLVTSTLYGFEIEKQIRNMGNNICKIIHI